MMETSKIFKVVCTDAQFIVLSHYLPKGYFLKKQKGKTRQLELIEQIYQKFPDQAEVQEQKQSSEVNPFLKHSCVSRGKMKRDQLDTCSQILAQIKRRRFSQQFRTPVDAIGLGIPHYYQIVKKPMDLKNMTQKLQKGLYTTFAQFYGDLKLISKNCSTFNYDCPYYIKKADIFISQSKNIIKKYYNIDSDDQDEQLESAPKYDEQQDQDQDQVQGKENENDEEYQSKNQNQMPQKKTKSYQKRLQGSNKKRQTKKKQQKKTKKKGSKYIDKQLEQNSQSDDQTLSHEMKDQKDSSQSNQQRQAHLSQTKDFNQEFQKQNSKIKQKVQQLQYCIKQLQPKDENHSVRVQQNFISSEHINNLQQNFQVKNRNFLIKEKELKTQKQVSCQKQKEAKSKTGLQEQLNDSPNEESIEPETEQLQTKHKKKAKKKKSKKKPAAVYGVKQTQKILETNYKTYTYQQKAKLIERVKKLSIQGKTTLFNNINFRKGQTLDFRSMSDEKLCQFQTQLCITQKGEAVLQGQQKKLLQESDKQRETIENARK